MSQAAATAPNPRSDAVSAIRSTCSELGNLRLAWDREVNELFDQFDSLAVQLAMSSSDAGRPQETNGRDDFWMELSQQQEFLVAQHQNSSLELSAMRQMIEQQTELLAAFVGAATQMTGPSRPTSVAKTRSAKSDPLVNAIQAEFAQSARPSAESKSGGRVATLGKTG